jgi:hemerythrin-like domain-containing protein
MGLLDTLMEEHRGFQTMLSVLEASAARVSRGLALPEGMLPALLDFFEYFTDGHHVREEHWLFPLLAEHGIGQDQSVVNALLAQHDAGRAYTTKMRADVDRLTRGDTSVRDSFAGHANGYVELIREHIRIEDSYFYGVAEGILSQAEKDSISEAFGRESSSRMSDVDRARYLAMMTEYPAIVAGWADAPPHGTIR